jgi:hypothetical protein
VGVRPPHPRRPPSLRGGNPFAADLSTVRFVKRRQSERRQVYFVTFDAMIPHFGTQMHTHAYVYPLERARGGGWRVIGGSGGAGDPPPRSSPWVNLGGGDLAAGFYAGGPIDNAGADVARVQLQFADGLILDDDSEEGAALFIADHPGRTPATAVLYDPAGHELATHPAFPDLHGGGETAR